MKNSFLFLLISSFVTTTAKAQVGVGTTTPNSTLDVRGSFSTNYRSFTTTSSAATDNMLAFTGTLAATLTLPDAATCAGRVYWIKNTSSNVSVLTIATTSAQTIDGLGSWTLDEPNQVVCLASDGANWNVTSLTLPSNSGNAWIGGGNTVTAVRNIGTKSNFDLPFITNNAEKMRLTATGNLGIGTTTFNGANPEKLITDAGATGNTNFQNVIVGKGNTNSYAQLNIQNNNAGTGASSDVVATADNGNESINYIDMGINSSANTSTGILSGVNAAYLYSTGGDFIIGNGTAAKPVRFFTGALATATEKMRLDGSGTTSTMTITGSIAVGSIRLGTGAYTVLSTDYVVINSPGGVAAAWTLPAASSAGCIGRIYRLINQGTGNITLSQSVRTANATTTLILPFAAGTNFFEILSDGTEWKRIN